MPLQIHPTQAVTVQPRLDDDGRCYTSTVRDLAPGEWIVIDAPVLEGVEVALPAGTPVSLQTTGVDGVRHCDTRVLRRLDGPAPLLELAWPDEVVRHNRRETLRLAAAVAVDVGYHAPGDETARVVRGTTLDLSEDGLRLVVPASIPTGTELSLRLHLPNSPEVFVCGGRVVRQGVSRFPGRGERPWLGIAFANSAPAMQRSLRKFLWSIQRENMRRGLRT